MKRRIKHIAIIGSGIMGSGIACHFANIGVNVLLLDITPRELTDQEKAKGISLRSKIVKNRIVNTALQTSLKAKPSPIYNKKFATRITTGNLDDDIAKIADVFHAWQSGTGYEDEKGFCFSAKLEDMQKHDYVLTPGRYVGAADAEEDSEPFPEKMQRLTAQLKSQFEESARLEASVKTDLAGIGYEL